MYTWIVFTFQGSPVSVEEKKPDQEVLIDFREDEFNKFEQHEVCWNLDDRGAVGETPFHLLVLHDAVATIEIAKILLSMYPKVSLDIYEGDEYYGGYYIFD